MLCLLSTGAFVGCRRTSRVQAAEAHRAQVDDPALLAVQGGLGLDHPAAGDVHGHLHAIRGRFPAQRGESGQAKQEVLRRPDRRHRPARRRHVHHRHPHQLPDHVRQLKRRGGQPPRQDCRPLPPGMVRHRRRCRHTLRPALPRFRNRRGTLHFTYHSSFLLLRFVSFSFSNIFFFIFEYFT